MQGAFIKFSRSRKALLIKKKVDHEKLNGQARGTKFYCILVMKNY